MIRELHIKDLNQNYFDLLCQLSGEKKSITNDIRNDCWAEYYYNPHHTIFVYENNGHVVGTASVLIENKMLHHGSSIGHVEDVVVDADNRLSGVGKKLIEKFLSFCEELKCYKVILDCSEKNVPFYESCGFHMSGNCMRRMYEH